MIPDVVYGWGRTPLVFKQNPQSRYYIGRDQRGKSWERVIYIHNTRWWGKLMVRVINVCNIFFKKSISLLAHALFCKSMSMEMCSRVEEMQISKYHMKGCKNEHNVDPVETGAIKKQSFNNFLTLFVMLCFTLFSILGIHLIKPQCHLAKRLH